MFVNILTARHLPAEPLFSFWTRADLDYGRKSDSEIKKAENNAIGVAVEFIFDVHYSPRT